MGWGMDFRRGSPGQGFCLVVSIGNVGYPDAGSPAHPTWQLNVATSPTGPDLRQSGQRLCPAEPEHQEDADCSLPDAIGELAL